MGSCFFASVGSVLPCRDCVEVSTFCARLPLILAAPQFLTGSCFVATKKILLRIFRHRRSAGADDYVCTAQSLARRF